MVLSSCSSCSCVPCPCEACKRRRMWTPSLNKKNDPDRDCEDSCRQRPSLQQRQTSGELRKFGEWKPSEQRGQNASTSAGQNHNEWNQGESIGTEQKFREYRPTTAALNKFGERKHIDDDDNVEDIHFRPKNNEDSAATVLGVIFKEVISIVTFFAVMTVCLWATLVSFGINSIKKLAKTDKSVRIMALFIVALLFLILLHGFVRHGIKSMQSSRNTSVKPKNGFFSWGPKSQRKTSQFETWRSSCKVGNPTGSGKKTSCKAQTDRKFWSEWHPGRTMSGWFVSLRQLKDKWLGGTASAKDNDIDDKWGEEVMKQMKFYSIPMEMKMPPQILVYLRDALNG